MNISDIEAFVALAETGSVNRAAIRLHITQPAATRRIQNFEDAMGAGSLLNRTPESQPVLILGDDDGTLRTYGTSRRRHKRTPRSAP